MAPKPSPFTLPDADRANLHGPGPLFNFYELRDNLWLGSELIKRLEHDGLEPLDLLLRGGEKLAEDKMLKPDDLWRKDHTIELIGRDRLRLLAAAERAPDFFLPSEAPDEQGAPILYELTASGFSSWVGDYLQDKQSNPKSAMWMRIGAIPAAGAR